MKTTIIEGFDNNIIDFEALNNLAKIAEKLNANGNFEFPGNLTVSGKLTVEDTVTAKKDLFIKTIDVSKSAIGCYILNDTVAGGGNAGTMGYTHGIWNHVFQTNSNDTVIVLPGFHVKIWSASSLTGSTIILESGTHTDKMINDIDSIEVRFVGEAFSK